MHNHPFSFTLVPGKVSIKIYNRDFKESSHYYLEGEVDVNEVTYNHQLITQNLQVSKLCVTRQVHSSDLLLVEQPWNIGQEPEVDGLITEQNNIALGVLTADCVPILLASGDGEFIASLHCGWRGLYNGIIENCALKLRKLTNQSINAFIGPSITYRSYNVDEQYYQNWVSLSKDFTQFFGEVDSSDFDRNYYCDLPSIAKYLLQRSNIQIIHHLDEDTFLNPSKYPSHRYATINNLGKYKGSILSTILKL